ncbi:putative G-protein coupled receptor 98, partial [Triplophysa rosa]
MITFIFDSFIPKVLNLLALNDDLPEVDEHFRVRLVSAESGDGKPGSTPTSGASIDPDSAINNISIKASDHPYGLLQFQTVPVPVGMIRPVPAEENVTVEEEAGVLSLLVARAQGLLGRVMVAYRTSPVSAVRSEDYEDTEGLLDFLPGERVKYINVTIIDNFVPELNKVFRVELYNPNGGVDQILVSEGSGSGDSDNDFFLPSFHYHHANLGAASRISVTIAASDEAHGVFQFSADSLAVNGTEPEEGRSTVVLQVIRTFGALSNVTLYWEADATSDGELVYRSGNITFEVGQTVGKIYLLISQDDIPEFDKSFKVHLTNVSHGRLGNETISTLTVLASDDPYGLFVFSDDSRPVRVAESNAVITLTIQRKKGQMGKVRVSYRTLRDTDAAPYSTPGVGRASAGNDFVPVMESVTFLAYQNEVNVTLRVLHDEEPERAESVFLELVNVTLVEGLQPRPVALSPRLGTRNVTVAQVIIEASDDAFGVLQLSSSAVSVPEYYTGPIINVTRIGGIFADVSVKFRAVPMTARVGEDYSVASSDVVLLEGESSKAVPILIINDVVPELEETFRIELLDQTTGGVLLGGLTQAVITILPSDDPYGSFVFQAVPVTIEEPAMNAFEVSLPIVRNAGTIGDVVVQWRATVNGRPATGDLRPASGEVRFAPGETVKTLKVEVLADDVPEIEEVIKVELINASNGGNIGAEKVVDIIVPANDNPHGTVYFEQAIYRVQEPLEEVYIANITVRRSGGTLGLLEILYSTSEIDVVSNALKDGRNLLLYYDSPLSGALSTALSRPFNVTSATNVLNFCAAFCLRERACQAFSYTSAPRASCFWVTSGTSQLSSAPQTVTYLKNTTAATSLFSSQAVAGSDYITMTAQTAIMLDRSGMANLTVTILTDSLPEVDESFLIKILSVNLINMTTATKNLPALQQPDTAVVTIGMNGDAFGIFLLYSISPNATEDGLYLEVRENPRTSVLLVIERRGGSMAQVTVEWKYVGGTATPNADFSGMGEIVIFAEGDVKKTLEIVITDDMEPEDNETIQIGLVRTEGGSRILPSSDTVTILILANDNAAGVVGFHTASRSFIVKEGERLPLLVERTAPAIGNVTVEWRIEGPQVLMTFVDISGTLFFSEGMLNSTIILKLLEDNTPEEKQEYRVILSNIQTNGVTKTGMAVLSVQGRVAVVSVEASDEPFGLLSITPSSLMITTEEKDTTVRIYINREFGASGAVNISFETVRGSLQDLTQTGGALAEPGQDFKHVSSSVIMQDGQTSVSIPITIIDDDIPELQEFFLVNITSAVLITTLPTGPILNTDGLMAEISIDANDGIQGIVAWQNINCVVNETIRVLTLVAYRDAGTYGNVSLFFYAQNLEAQLGLDFNVTPSMINFADGEQHKFIEVQILDDNIPEGDETFQLILANPSVGLELGENTSATVTILANDDGNGIISFNNIEHFLLREPTSVSGLGESVATLYILRDPPQGTFGTVTVQFTITDANGSLYTDDLTPSYGFVVLEDGVRFKTLEIWAVLDAEPEVNETFIVTLSSPTGGARLGHSLETFITVLQNQAPLGLFRISPSFNRTLDSMTVEEYNGRVFLTVSRSNGLESAVSVEWETRSGTAFGMRGEHPVLAVYQSVGDSFASVWCQVPNEDSTVVLRLLKGPSQNQAILYRWQGVLVPVEFISVESPSSCVGFAVNGSSYVAVSHAHSTMPTTARISLYHLQADLNLTHGHTLSVSGFGIKHFSIETQQYLIASSEIFEWTGDSFSLHQNLGLQGITTVTPFRGSSGSLQHLAVCMNKTSDTCLIYQWSNGHFQKPQSLTVNARVKQVESFDMGGDTFLAVVTEGEDYSVASSDVVLLEGESSKAVPILIINDVVPELEETFRIELLDQTTGGVLLGGLTQAVITILPSDDPYGSFVFQAVPVTIEEPAMNAFEVSLPIVRNAGTIGDVVVQWRATVNGRPATGDLRPASGEVRFAPGETVKTLKVEVLADDVPEIEEVIKVELINASNGGNIGAEKVVDIIVPANDNPHGTVYFEQAIYRVQEPLEEVYIANITVRRSGGTLGLLEILYSTSEIDVVSNALKDGRNLLLYYDSPLSGALSTALSRPFNVTSATNVLNFCAAFCLRERACQAFSYTSAPRASCFWVTSGTSQLSSAPQTVTYLKNTTAATSLFSSQAVAGSDYITMTAQTAIMLDRSGMANLTVTILTDSLPEVDESFLIKILSVNLINMTTATKNLPALQQPDTAVVTIGMNGDAFGIFLLYSISPNATEDGLYLEVRENPRTSVLLVIERRGGSMAQVTVEWKYVGGTATPNADFSGMGEIVIFAEGDVKKTLEIVITDDMEPEDNETIQIGLVRTEGGSRILPSSDTVTILILANDNAAGVVGFHTASRSFIVKEGERLPLLVERTAPAIGNVTVEWRIEGPQVLMTFVDISGTLFFSEGMLNSTIILKLLEDNTPEEKQEYRVILSNIQTNGVTKTGMAVLSVQGRVAVVSVEASDEPFGLLSITPSSLMITTEEKDTTVRIYINREFGASGAVNISFETVRGSLQDLTQTGGALAEPGQDFKHVSSSVIMQDGQTSVSIPITIIDDDIPELQEFFLVNITSAVLITTLPTGPILNTDGLMAEISIDANDGIQGIVAWQNINCVVNETIRVLTLVAYRDAGTYGNVSLFFYAQNLEAQLGLDFNVTPSMINFADGEQHKFIEVQILDDNIPEGDETFQLILANPSVGLELGENTSATVTILANDDGNGIISFNNIEHFLLREPTSVSGLGESVATLYILRDPPQGTFGTVTVQFTITDANGSLYTDDLTPSYGFVVLEDGVRFKTLEIWAVLDAEPEVNETFIVTLSSPTGGARLGHSLETFITVLQNQAPLGLFRISPSFNRTLDSMTVEEYNGRVFLTVSRSNGLESAVSVEWETRSGTAFGMRGEHPVLAVYQSVGDSFASVWCQVPNEDSTVVLRLLKGPSQNQAILYRWQGVLVPVEFISVESPSSCVGFAVNGSSYVAVSHAHSTMPTTARISLYHLQADLNLTHGHTLSVSGFGIKHFSIETQQYLIASSEIFEWTGDSFSLHQNLGLQGITTVTPFRGSSGSLQHLAVCMNKTSDTCLIYQWSNGHFQKPQSLTVNARVKQVESFDMGGDTFLAVVTEEGPSSTCQMFMWGSQQSFFLHSQSIPFPGLFSVHPFTPPSGISHVLLAGLNGSTLYAWRSNQRQFAEVLKSPSAQEFLYVPVRSFNLTKSLILATGESNSVLYELTSVSNQSDFIPNSGELFFQPGVHELEIAVNVIDDDVSEVEEHFRVSLKNPKGGAEIGFRGQVTLFIPANDDAYGIVGFAQNSLMRDVDELVDDNPVSLTIERRRGRSGRLTVHWRAYENLDDIFPTSGVVTFSESQAVATISLNILADDIPELAEKVSIVLTKVTTIGLIDPSRGAMIDPQRGQANLTIKANGSPYGVIGWHLDSQYFITPEPQKSPSNITLSIVRDQGASGDVLVHYTTKVALHLPPVNQASEGVDYVAKEATVILMVNATVVLVTITILPDDIPELAETFLVNITGVELVGMNTGAGQPSLRRPGLEIAEIIIQENNDPRGILGFNVSKGLSGEVLAYEVPPPGNILRLAVIRTAGRSGRVVLYWEVQAVTANTEDFNPSSGNLTFQDGQSVANLEITIIDDTIVESTETFIVKLVRVVGGAQLGNETSVVISIPANDSPFGRFGFEELMVSVSEPSFLNDPASVATLTVVRSSGEGGVHLIWLLQEEGKEDLIPRNGSLVFNGTESKKTLVIQALADAVLEGEERFTIQLLSAKAEPVIDPVRGVATVVIQADMGALGTVGIADSSRNIMIGEPVGNYNGTALISLVRGPGIFGEIEIYWSITPAVETEFEENSGKVILKDRQSAATIQLKALDDETPEEKCVYQLSLTSLTLGSSINPDRQNAFITMAASDLPHGLFSFSQSSLRTTEEDRAVNVTVVRSMGLFGSVWVSYHTEGRTAASGQDFGLSSGRLLFRPGEALKVITLTILDDNLPEGPEDFFLNITLVELLNASSMDFTVKEYGLQFDQPPAVGNLSSIMVIIQKNDNAEGILEFDPNYVNITVEEDIGIMSIPVLRRIGSYGKVTAEFISRGLTGHPDSDYILPNGSITFQHGETYSYINVSIVDDLDSELTEIFEMQLTGATAGAILGAHLIAWVTIAKSDSPSGVVRFINQSAITIPNPNSILRLSLLIERAEGVLGDATVTWHILGPNSNEVLPSVNTDIGEPVNGSFSFRDGEGGVRSIELKILPHGEVEVVEKFVVVLSILSGEMDVDPKARSVTLSIDKFGDPNGIVQFTEQDLIEHVYNEPSYSDGPLSISVLITRREGVMGNITVFWKIMSDADTTGDFSSLHGFATVLAGQRVAEIILTLLPDSVPELEESYTLRLMSVEGGAELDANRSIIILKVRANDEPHGMFALYPQNQSVGVNVADRSRYLIISVTRLAGAFGNVSVVYRISFTTPGQSFTEDTITGNILVKDGEQEASAKVPLSSQVFFATGFNFNVELKNVTLIGPLLSSPPRIKMESNLAIVSVPEVAANAEVGFASLALSVTDVESGQCEALLRRNGLYGNVTVRWSAGFPPGQTPAGYQPGDISPRSGMVMLAHGQRGEVIHFNAVNNTSGVTAHAIYLTSVESDSPGGARFRPGDAVAEVEPLGFYQFHPDSRHLVIKEDVQTITLHVQRLYGFRSNRSSISYETWPGSAHPRQDFVPITDGQVLFDSRQSSAVIRLSIVDDSLTEPDENFYVNLTSVRDLSASLPLAGAQPHIVSQHGVATITILANDVVGGFLSIGPALIRISEDSQEGAPQQKLALRVWRTVGLTGMVSVKIRAYTGGLKSQEVDVAQFHQEHNGTWALEGEDFALETQIITMLEGQNEVEVSVVILNDPEPEGQEAFFIYLSEAEGGAEIVSVPDELGLTSFAKIIILGSDLQNGIVGFSLSSQSGQVLDEDSENRTIALFLQRQENRAFEDVLVFWRVTFSTTVHSTVDHAVNLTRELQQTSGTALCRKGEVLCTLRLEVRPDKDPEYQVWFLVEVYKVGEGAAINQTARFANVTMLESDDPRGLVYFAQGSRLPVVTLRATSVSLQVYRDANTASAISVKYSMQELQKAESIGPTLIWPAVVGQDFIRAEGTLTFDIGQRSANLDVVLTPDFGSSNPTPKRFRVFLSDATGGARVHPEFGWSNLTLVSDSEAQAIWALLDQLHQPLDETIINRVLQGLIDKVSKDITQEQLTAVLDALNKILKDAEQTPLKDSSRGLTYDLLCAMAKPSRTDTRGLSQLAEVTERFAFTLVTDTECGAEGKRGRTILDTCPYFNIAAHHWYPTQINGHTFTGINTDTFTLPGTLLEVPALPAESIALSACRKVHFTEYSTEHWFLTNTKASALNNKVFSVSVQSRGSKPLDDGQEVVYRIHTPDRRWKLRQSLCLLWNQAAESWLSDGQFCRVVDENQNFVECACSHLSVYTAYAETGSLASFNEAFYAAGFICISGFAMAIVSHVLCSRFLMFAAKLLTHMMVACLGTQ